MSVSPLPTSQLVAFVGTTDPARAKAFYGGLLGLSLLSEDMFALVFDANGAMLRVAIVPAVVVAGYTVVGWNVTDATATASYLAGVGIQFERFQGLPQDELGIWTAPGGAKVAWFKDPEGNLLSIAQLQA